MDIVLNIILLLALVYLIFLLSYSMFRGAPFAAISKGKINTMLKLLNPSKGKKFLDLGSGDGRIVNEASKRVLKAYGYEINPLLVLISRYKLKKGGSNGRILLKDYWRENLADFDYIAVWGLPHMMKRLEKKLLRELRPGTKVVSNHSKFPNWKAEKNENDVFLYIK